MYTEFLSLKKLVRLFAGFDNGGNGKENVIEITVTGSKGNFSGF